MADSTRTVDNNDLTDFDVAQETVSTREYQIVKVDVGAVGATGRLVQGQATKSASLPVTLASDEDAIALAAGSASIGTLGANSGVDIGDVDVTSVVPGTGATNLGKAVDDAVGATDTGVAVLAKHQEDQVHLTTADGDYDHMTLDSLGSLHVNAEAHHVFDTFNATTGWTALNSDTTNLATTKKHVSGTDALTFDKADGAANTVFAAIQKTLTSVDLGAVSPHDLIQGTLYIPDLTNVDYAFLRLGTDASNYNEWRLPDTSLTAATFEVGALPVGDATYAGITGNGWDPSAITYMCVGVAFDAETNTLTGIVFDEVSYHTNQHTSALIGTEVTTQISTANINVHRVGGQPTDTAAGNASTGTQRVTLATDDANAAAILADTAAMDTNLSTLAGAVTGTEMQVDIVADGAGLATAANQSTANTSLSNIEAGVAAEDAALGSGVLIQGDDGTDRKNINVDATTGDVQVDVTNTVTVGSHDVTNAGTFAVQEDGAALTALQLIDDIVYTDDTDTHATGTSKGCGIMAAATPTDSSVTANDIGMVAMSLDRRLHVDADITASVALDCSAATVTVDNGGTFATQVNGDALTALQLIDNCVHVDDAGFTLGTHSGVMAMGFAGTQSVDANDACALACDTDGALHISDGGNTITVDGTITANAGTGTMTVDLGSNNDVTASGNVADDATTPQNPVMIGGSAKETDGTDPGSVSAEDDVTRCITDRNRRLLVNTTHPNLFSASENHATAQTNNELVAAPGASLSLYLTDVVISNGATAGSVKIVRDTGGTPVDIIEETYVAANGGATIHFNTPIRLPANINLGFTSTTVTTHSITVNGYTAP